MENLTIAQDILLQLKLLGVRIYIDDFGIGYSSLSYLYHFPIDVLKIDRSFVARMQKETSVYRIVRTIIALARELRIEVVSEGWRT